MNSTGSPSVAAASSMDRVGSVGGCPSSSSLMVPVAVPSSMVAPTGLPRVTVKVSVSSWVVSSVVGTEMVRNSSVGEKVRVSDVSV